MHWMFIAGLVGVLVYMVTVAAGLDSNPTLEFIGSAGLGVATGMIVIGVIFTGRNANKIREFKQRLLKRK